MLTVIRQPFPAIVALAIGLFIGIGAKATVFADDSKPPEESALTEAPVEPSPPQVTDDSTDDEPRKGRQRDRDQREDEAEGGGGFAGIKGAIDDYDASLSDGSQVGVVVTSLDGSEVVSGGSVSAGQPWSVMKVPAAAAFLNFKKEQEGTESGVAAMPEGSSSREDLGLALVQSDNLGIRRPIQEMIEVEGAESAAARINQSLAAGGISSVSISPEIDPEIDSLDIGTGVWSLSEAAEWFRRLQSAGSCVGLAEDDRIFILRQLRAAATALPWGAAAAVDPATIALKPGWGDSGGTYTTEQAVIVGGGDEADGFVSEPGGYVMVLMAQVPSSGGAFETGQAHLQEMAELVSRELEGSSSPTGQPNC